MLSINASGEGVLIAPLDRSHLDTAVKLYGYSGDYRFATGQNRNLSGNDLLKKLTILQCSNREFFDGIFISGGNMDSCFLDTPVLQTDTKQLVGLISGILYGKVLWIKMMAILPQFRHKGLGSRSTALLLKDMQLHYGVREVCLSVVRENDNARNFWIRQGFYEDGRIQKKLFQYESPYVVIILRKKL